MRTKNIQLSVIILVTLLFSCSKDNVNDSSNPDSSSILVKKITTTSSNNTNTDVYSYNGNKLTEVHKGNSSEYVKFTYQGDFITRMAFYVANNQSGDYTDYFYSNNLLSQSKAYSANVLQAKFDYLHNTDGTIEITEITYSNGTTYTDKTKEYFDSSGNLIKKEELRYSPPPTTIYGYDNKNNPLKNITGWNICFPSNINNKIKVNYSNIIETFSYQYNSQGYPVSCNYTSQTSENKTITYFY